MNKSQRLVQFLLLIHSLAAFACLANALFWLYQLIALVAVGCSLFFYLRHTHFQPYQIKSAEDAVWSVTDKDGAFQTVQMLDSSVVTVWLIVLHVRFENGKRQNLVIFNDALSEKEYRSLMVNLKIAGLPQKNYLS